MEQKIVRIEALDMRDFQFQLANNLLLKWSIDRNNLLMLQHLMVIKEQLQKGQLQAKEYIDLRFEKERVK